MYREPFAGRKRLQVLNRLEAESCTLIDDEPHIVISIVGPPDPQRPSTLDAEIDPKVVKEKILKHSECKDVLSIVCSDINHPQSGRKLFSNTQAAQIVGFLQAHKDINYIVVHCEAGVSRSAGVAAALDNFFNGEMLRMYKHFRPNALIARRVLEALHDFWDTEPAEVSHERN